MTQTNTRRSALREPMVWMLIGIPLASVIMGVVMITLAVNNNDGLVVDDYYKQGLEINRTLERDARAGELELAADIAFEPSDNRVSLSLSGAPAFQPPAEISLGFYHATRKGEDQVLSLRRDARGMYSAPMPVLAKGRWYVSAETSEWRLTRAVYFPVDDGFSITHRSQPTPDGGSRT